MSLEALWFVLVAVLWTGFLVLEGFDFGVGMLHSAVGHDEAGRRVALGTVGPLWDGNEVWLVVAAAGMFAAFPGWYATLFSGAYLLVVLLLLALIARGVAFEFRGRADGTRWRHNWSVAVVGSSVKAPLVIGIVLGNLLHGLPIRPDQEYAGTVLDLFRPYALLAGVTLALLCLLHGATFLALKTTGDIRDRAGHLGRRVSPLVVLAVLGFLTWTHIDQDKGLLPSPLELAAGLAVLAAAMLVGTGRDGYAFTATAVALASVVLTLFVDLYPRVMVSTLGPANDLTVANTASSSYTLTLMSVVALVLLPVVVAYQGWTYYVFRRRMSREDLTPRRLSEAVPPQRTSSKDASKDAKARPTKEST